MLKQQTFSTSNIGEIVEQLEFLYTVDRSINLYKHFAKVLGTIHQS